MTRSRPSLSQDLIWRLEALGLDLLGLFFRLMPVELASTLGGAALRLIGPLSGAHKTAERNLRIAFPHMDKAERDRLLVAQWDNLGRLTAEFQLMHRLTPATGRVEIVGGEHLRAVAQSGKPAVLISGHFSNWEVMAAVIVHLGVRCDVTYRAANNPYIDARIIETRRRYGVTLMAPKGETGSREVMRAMNQGVSVALLNDQKFNQGLAAPFFGVTAHTAPGPTRFALKFGCPMIPMCVERTEGARFRVTIYESIAPPNTGDRTADIEQGVRNVNAFIEARVRERPDQWFWTHKRWPSEAYAALEDEA
ncbi:MAG: lipid biosynthesis acyltransferase [Caulobacteraceae bacterium]|jgi:KDO2-lipid IV(A) lauroyltransferase|nr:lipid biosynthesis acyltransferase [Caulobacteraceae bacterium]